MKAVFFILLIVSAFSLHAEGENALNVKFEEGVFSFSDYKIYTEGSAHPTTKERSIPNVRLSLQREAESIAALNALALLSKLNATGEYSIGAEIERNSELNAYVLRLMETYQLESVTYPKYGVKVRISFPFLGNGGIVEKVFDEIKIREDFPAIEYKDSGTSNTGLIIDARGFEVVPALFPSVYNESGDRVYSPAMLNKTSVVSNGAILYVTNLTYIDEKRVGKNPYKTMAWGVMGRFKSDIVISDEESFYILSDEFLKNSLRDCKIVIITE